MNRILRLAFHLCKISLEFFYPTHLQAAAPKKRCVFCSCSYKLLWLWQPRNYPLQIS